MRPTGPTNSRVTLPKSQEKRSRGRWWSGIGLAPLMLFALAAMAQQKSLPPALLVWPPPPEPARIVYRHTVSRAQDLGWKRSWWRKALDWMLYTSDPSILRQPYAVALDSNLRLIIADAGAHDVKIFDPFKKSVRVIRGYKKMAFGMPVALAIDAADNFYVADSASGRVLKYSPEGKLLAYIGGEEGGFKQPTGLAYNRSKGLLYVVDTMRPRVFAYDSNGNLVNQFGKRGVGPGEFNFPTFIAIDRHGMLYVNDTLNFRIQVFTPEGKFAGEFGALGNGTGDMNRAKGLALDSREHIYVADATFSTVQIFDREGNYLLNFGSQGSSPAQFYIPIGVTIDMRDYIYVADPFQGRIEIFHYLAESQATQQQQSLPGGAK